MGGGENVHLGWKMNSELKALKVQVYATYTCRYLFDRLVCQSRARDVDFYITSIKVVN